MIETVSDLKADEIAVEFMWLATGLFFVVLTTMFLLGYMIYGNIWFIYNAFISLVGCLILDSHFKKTIRKVREKMIEEGVAWYGVDGVLGKK